MKHALLSPSSSHRWMVCKGSVQANLNKPWEQNEWSLLGTSAHNLLEVCMRIDADPAVFEGKVLQKGHVPVDEEMADSVGYALDYVKSYLAHNPTAKVYIETPVFMDAQLGITPEEAAQLMLEFICWGTPDIVIDNYPKECVTVDYKHGIGHAVQVKENTQIRLYHLGSRQRRGRYRRYRSVVIQPRLRGRKPVQEHTITDAQLVEWRDTKVIPILPEALSKNSERVAGEHCTFCAADGNCKAQYEFIQSAASKEFKTNDPKALSPAQVSTLLNSLVAIEKIGKAVRERAIRLVHAGVDIPDWEADTTAPRRMYRNEQDAEKLLETLGLHGQTKYEPKTLLSPAKAEAELIRLKKMKRKSRRAGVVWESPLVPVIAYTESNPTIRRKT